MKKDSVSNKKLTLVVLAAGMGSRYGGIKQIDGFGPNGETIMDYSLFDAVRAGFNKVIFIVRPDILETVREKFESKLRGKMEIAFAIQTLDKLVLPSQINPQRVKPWGTAHAVLCARDLIGGPFVVINADDFYGKDSFASIANYFRNDTSGAHPMVGYTLKNVLSDHGSVSRGVGETDKDGFLIGVVERKTIVKENDEIVAKEKDGDVILDPNAPTSMNFSGFYPNIFPFWAELFEDFVKKNYDNITAEFFIPIVGNALVKQNKGRIKVIGGGNIWFGVTYKDDKDAVSKNIKDLIARGDYPTKLW